MGNMPEAVTLDFHNTIARCDEWFQLEVRDLVSAFFSWHTEHNGSAPSPVSHETAVAAYRHVRQEVIEHGLEKDAVTCVELVTAGFGFAIDRAHISNGISEIMHATLPGSTAMPGVIDGIKRLKRSGVRLGVVSSAVYHPFLQWSLEKFGVLDAFDAIITSASSGYYKSRTEIYTLAAEALGTTPERTVHVGDSVIYDVATASRAGMGTILYQPDGEAVPDGGANAVVRSFDDIEHVVADVHQGMRV